MRPLLVLASNQQEYMQWAREHREEMEARGLAPRYMPEKTLNYLGYDKCFYLEVGTFYRSSRHDEMYRYFQSHGILNVKQVEGQVA